VSGTLRMRGAGLLNEVGEQQEKVETLGTVIHESGLTLISHAELDPGHLINSIYSGVKAPGQEGKVEVRSELTGVKIRLADGKEVASRLVLTDPDLDVAFVVPTEPRKLPYIDLF